MEPNTFIKDVKLLGIDRNKAAIQLDYIHRIINNGRMDVSEEERRNPVIFDKPCRNFIEMDISIVNGRDSAKWLSGGNFDFNTNTGTGFVIQLRYPDYDAPIKEAIAIIRGLGFSCFPGKKSTTCFLAGKEPDDEGQAKLLAEVAEAITSKMLV
jgi:hypothetical protein